MAINFTSRGLIRGIANATNTPVLPFTVAGQSPFEEAFRDLREAGMSATDMNNTISSVNSSAQTVQVEVNGRIEEHRVGEVININGTDFTVRADGQLETDTIVVSAPRPPEAAVDARLRISALRGRDNETRIYGENTPTNIMAPLHATGGMLFPYTPSLQISGEATWSAHDLTHTNFDVLSYQRTPSATIGITGKFTVQNQREGEYAIAVIHFLRTVTKMHYGDRDSAQNNAAENAGRSAIAGLPPPVLRLRGYGNYMFNDLRCVVKSYSFNFDDNMDLNLIRSAGGSMYLPPMFTLTVTLGLQQSPRKVRRDFQLSTFRTGEALRSEGGNWF